MSRLEVWQFEIDEARTPEAPRLYVAPRQCSRAPRCVSGGSICTSTDFLVGDYYYNRTVLRRDARRRRRYYNITRRERVRWAPQIPRALSWGYYLETDPLHQWTQVAA